jgi:spectinomycin phosphotransferase/16S rRNA (guanine(1405)-N(7))-methyltransferase
MLNPPHSFSEDGLRALLANSWKVQVATLAYVPVGFGSHHWSVQDTDGGRWFVNVDDLAAFPLDTDDPLRSLGNALSVPRALVDGGHPLTVAPEPTIDGAPLAELGTGFAVSVHRHLDGESFDWQPWEKAGPGLAAEALAVVTDLHRVPRAAWGAAEVETFAIPKRAGLEALLTGQVLDAGLGPFARHASRAISRRAPALSALLAHYDRLAEEARAEPDGFVLTHGEPHLGNFMRVGGRLLLIDWDSARIGPPERDLWSFGLGDPRLRELFRLRWDLAETAVDLAQFAAPHTGAANERTTWTTLVDTLAALETTAARI